MQSPLISVSRLRVIPSGFLGILLVFFWMLYIHLANVEPVSLDAKILTPEWQSLYLARLPVSLLLIGTTIFQWWSKSSRSHQEQDEEKGLSKLFYSRSFYFLLTFLTILACRWNTLAGYEFNYDASQSITAARTLFHDPRFWVSVDVGTHGPGVAVPQMILPLCGIAIDYAGSRLLGIIFMFVCMYCVFVIIRRLADEFTSRLVLIPSIFIVAALTFSDYVEYNGEHPIVLFMMLSLACITSAFFPEASAEQSDPMKHVSEKHALIMLFVGGLILGFIPWTKVQGVPLTALILLIGGMGAVFVNVEKDDSSRFRKVLNRLFLFASGFLIPTIAIVSGLIYDNSLSLMFNSYINWNLVYAKRNDSSFLTKLWNERLFLAKFIVGTTYFHLFVQPITIIALVLYIRSARHQQLSLKFALVILSIVLGALVIIIAPGNGFFHYLVFLLFPLCLIYSVLWLSLLRLSGSRKSLGQLIFLLGGIFIPFIAWGFTPSRYGDGKMIVPFTVVKGFNRARSASVLASRNRVISYISEITEPGDYIGVWGWRPEIFVKTNTLSATRSSVNMREAIRELPMSDYFCDLFLQDLKLKRPRVFVDNSHRYDFTVLLYTGLSKANTTWPKRTYADFQYENYPQLKEWIDSNYTLYVKVDSGVRIFTRKDLAIPRKTTLSK